MEEKYVTREEFEHFIAEFEAFRESHMDELTNMIHRIEVLTEQLEDFSSSASRTEAQGQSKLL